MSPTIPIHHVLWKKAWRLVSARIPSVPLYQRLGDADDQHNLIALEQLTNPRVQAEKGVRSFLRPNDFFPQGRSTYIHAAFSYVAESRFGDGAIPILYAASDEATAVAEKRFHWGERLRAHQTPATVVTDVSLHLSINGQFHDLRGLEKICREAYRPNTYAASQILGRRLWQSDSQGIAYTSVRYSKGECAAVFSPQTLTACKRDTLYEFHWDGRRVSAVFRLDPR